MGCLLLWIHTMELKDVYRNTRSPWQVQWESIQWNWKSTDSSPPAGRKPTLESIQWNWKGHFWKDQDKRRARRIHTMELKGSWDMPPNHKMHKVWIHTMELKGSTSLWRLWRGSCRIHTMELKEPGRRGSRRTPWLRSRIHSMELKDILVEDTFTPYADTNPFNGIERVHRESRRGHG